jgi:hypothetical protein
VETWQDLKEISPFEVVGDISLRHVLDGHYTQTLEIWEPVLVSMERACEM